MDRIASEVEADPGYAARVHFIETRPDRQPTADALAEACASIARARCRLRGSSCSLARAPLHAVWRVSVRACPCSVLTPSVTTARKVGLLWGAHAVATKDIGSFEEMIAKGKRMALRHAFGDRRFAADRAGRVCPSVLQAPPICSTWSPLTGDELAKHKP